MKKKYGVIIAIILLVTSTSFFSFANEKTKYDNQLKEAEKKIQNISNQIKKTEKKEGQVISIIQKLESEIEKSEKEINGILNNISKTEKDIIKTIDELKTAEENIEDKEDIMGERLNVMYRNGTIGYVEVLLNSESFTDLLTNLDMVKKIFNHDVELLEYLQEQKDIIQEQKNSLENQKRQLVNLKADRQQKQTFLQVSRGEQQRLREDLAKDKVAMGKMLDQHKREADEAINMIRSLQSSSDYVGGVLQWPVPGYNRISSPYGNRIHPITKTNKFHSGIDIPAPSGKNVVAAGDGKVVSAGSLGGYGQTVIIDHGGGIMTLYAHNSRLLVAVGQNVSKGKTIARIGSTGMSTGPHLHFEVRKDGQYTNPISYVK